MAKDGLPEKVRLEHRLGGEGEPCEYMRMEKVTRAKAAVYLTSSKDNKEARAARVNQAKGSRR